MQLCLQLATFFRGKTDCRLLAGLALPADSSHEKRPPGLGLWQALVSDAIIPIHHFKWHAGLLNNMRDRQEWYRCGAGAGRCTACLPACLGQRGVLHPSQYVDRCGAKALQLC